MSYIIKNLGEAVVKDIDSKEGIVVGYFSKFGNVDSDNDIMQRGCYAKSISEKGPNSARPRIAHLWSHDTREPIGKLLKLEEDSYGLRFESKMSRSTKGRDVLTMYEEGIINEHSVGFRGIKWEDKVEDENKPWDRIRTYKECELWEGSSVVFGANPDTPTTGVKEASPESVAKAVERLERLQKLLRTGKNLSDEAFIQMEIECAQIVKDLSSLATEEPPRHSEENEPDILAMWRELSNS